MSKLKKFVNYIQIVQHSGTLLFLIIISSTFSYNEEISRTKITASTDSFQNISSKDWIIGSLTEEERQWLKKHPVIRVAEDPDRPPLEFINSSGELCGISNEYLEIMQKKLGIRFLQIKNLRWQDSYTYLKTWDIDMATCFVENPMRAKFLIFTKPYIRLPVVILTKTDIPYIAGLKELTGKKIAVVDGHNCSELIPRDYPQLQLVKVTSVKEGISLLQKGNVYALVDNMLVIQYYLSKLNSTNLRVAGITPYENAQCMAIRKDWPVFRDILQKVFDSISDDERAQIYNKWRPAIQIHKFNYVLFWHILSAFFIISAVLLFWNRKLAYEIKLRKKAEASRREFEELLKESLRLSQIRSAELSAIIEAIPHSVYFGNDQGITKCNKLALQMFEAQSIQELKNNILEIKTKLLPRYSEYGTDSVETNDLPFVKSLQGKASQLDTWITKSNGENRLIQGYSAPVIVDGNVIGAVVINLDITGQWRAQNALLKAKEIAEQSEKAKSDMLINFRESQSAAKIGNWVWDLIHLTAWWSDELYNIFELDHTYVPSVNGNKKYFHPDDYEHYYNAVNDALSNGGELNHDFRIITPKGHIKYCNSRGIVERDKNNRPIRFFGTFMDITESKEAELTLAAEKERLAVTLRSIADGVITTDISGNITLLNNAAEQLTGWSMTEAFNKPLNEVFCIINEITRQRCENSVEKVLKTCKVIEPEDQTILISRNGREIIIADNASPITDKDGKIIGVVLVFRDITEKIKLLENAQRTDKLNSIGVLAGGIAHDFNNLLCGIFGYIDLALETCDAESETSHYLNKAFKAFTRAKDLTLQLLTFSKGGAPICKSGSLATLLKDSTEFALSGSNSVCSFHIANDLWLCDFDENQMAQVIDNIIINAVQAMPHGGNITIKAENYTIRDRKVHYLKKEKYVHVSINDTGLGIPPSILSRIFDPFFTTKPNGNGLGLSTVYSIIKKHDGEISVESELGKGTTFHIFLPISVKIDSINACKDTYSHKGSGRILVMDDEDYIREIADDMLTSMGYEVAHAADGREALILINDSSQNNNPFIAIIMDLTIPGGIGGKEAIKELRKFNKDMFAFVSSGYSEDPVMANPIEYGFTDRIMKPFRKSELIEMLVRHLGMRNELDSILI